MPSLEYLLHKMDQIPKGEEAPTKANQEETHNINIKASVTSVRLALITE